VRTTHHPHLTGGRHGDTAIAVTKITVSSAGLPDLGLAIIGKSADVLENCWLLQADRGV